MPCFVRYWFLLFGVLFLHQGTRLFCRFDITVSTNIKMLLLLLHLLLLMLRLFQMLQFLL